MSEFTTFRMKTRVLADVRRHCQKFGMKYTWFVEQAIKEKLAGVGVHEKAEKV